MARLQPYQYIVLKHPLEDDEEVQDSKILLESSEPLLAKNQETATMKVARLIEEKDMEDLDRIEFFVRPF
jgi:hypothetical protein